MSVGVYALGSIAGQVSFSTVTATTDDGTSHVFVVRGKYFITARITSSFMYDTSPK